MLDVARDARSLILDLLDSLIVPNSVNFALVVNIEVQVIHFLLQTQRTVRKSLDVQRCPLLIYKISVIMG